MNYIIDWGNTRLKLGIFEDDRLTDVRTDLSATELSAFVNEQKPQQLIVSSVNQDAIAWAAQLNESIPRVLFDSATPLPVQNKYATPSTLGADRLASVIGARQFASKGACLVIDAGTCITYDILNSEDEYLGGAISPGLEMRFKALHTFTARLPKVEAQPEAPLTGKTTIESMLSGVINGTVSEVEGMIRQYRKEFSNLQVFICGGDAKFFESKIKADIFVVSDLVLIGLNKILQYNDPKIAQK